MPKFAKNNSFEKTTLPTRNFTILRQLQTNVNNNYFKI
jgi:hypothetical protein